jgi:hypothetical protein
MSQPVKMQLLPNSSSGKIDGGFHSVKLPSDIAITNDYGPMLLMGLWHPSCISKFDVESWVMVYHHSSREIRTYWYVFSHSAINLIGADGLNPYCHMAELMRNALGVERYGISSEGLEIIMHAVMHFPQNFCDQPIHQLPEVISALKETGYLS